MNSSSNYCCNTHNPELWEIPVPVSYCGRSVAIIPVIEDFKFPHLEPYSVYPLSPTLIFVHHTETRFACCTYSKDDKNCFFFSLSKDLKLRKCQFKSIQNSQPVLSFYCLILFTVASRLLPNSATSCVPCVSVEPVSVSEKEKLVLLLYIHI